MNTLYRDLILARVQAAVGAAHAVTGIGHQGLKGQLREIVMRDLLRPLFPSDVGLGTGVIITSHDHQSKQQDVVIFDRSIVPPILLEGNTGVFPIESVLATVEVKTKLTAAEIKSTLESAHQLRNLPHLSGKYNEAGQPISTTLLPSISTLLAFGTDLSESGESEIERFDKIRGSTNEEPPILGLCVVGRRCWLWMRDKCKWFPWPTSYPLQEVLGLISGLMNSYKYIAVSRNVPRMGMYLES